MRKFIPAVLIVLVAIVGLAAPAWAQDVPAAEISGGYNLLKFTDETLPGGWYADVAGNATSMFGIVGQVSGNYKSVDVLGVSVDTKVHTFMGGARVTARVNSPLSGFAQVLAGAARADGSSDLSGLLPFAVSDSTTDAALQIGGGVSYIPSRGVGARVGADYVRIFSEEEGTNVFRFSAGVIVPLGRR